MNQQNWKDKHYAKFINRDCEFFPCHGGVPEETFNCLFCYCPLYALGKDCGGAYHYTEKGIKDCSGCAFPHHADNYAEVIRRLSGLYGMMQEQD